MKHILIYILLSLLTSNLYSQEFSIYGSVTDENKEPLIGATIQVNDSFGVSTNINGNFNLVLNESKYIKADSLNIKIRHIGYEELDTTLLNQGENIFINARLKISQNVLPNIIVNSDLPKSIFNKEMNLLDFIIADGELVTLWLNNKTKNISTYSQSGFLLESESIDKRFNLLHKSFGKRVYAIGKENCVELDFDSGINKTRSYPRSKFENLIEKCVLLYNGHYIFKEYSNHNKRVTYFTYPNPSTPKKIAEVYDEKAYKAARSYYKNMIRRYNRTIANLEENNIAYGIGQTNKIKNGKWNGNLLDLIVSNELHELVSYYISVESKKIETYEFIFDEKLLIFDLVNFKIHVLDNNLNKTYSLNLEDKNIWENSLVIIQDDTNSNLYLINKKRALFSIEINKDKVQLQSIFQLDNTFGLVSKFLIHNNSLFFLSRNTHNHLAKLNMYKIK